MTGKSVLVVTLTGLAGTPNGGLVRKISYFRELEVEKTYYNLARIIHIIVIVNIPCHNGDLQMFHNMMEMLLASRW